MANVRSFGIFVWTHTRSATIRCGHLFCRYFTVFFYFNLFVPLFPAEKHQPRVQHVLIVFETTCPIWIDQARQTLTDTLNATEIWGRRGRRGKNKNAPPRCSQTLDVLPRLGLRFWGLKCRRHKIEIARRESPFTFPSLNPRHPTGRTNPCRDVRPMSPPSSRKPYRWLPVGTARTF